MATAEEAKEGQRRADPATILIIDDDRPTNDVLSRVIRWAGHISLSAFSAEDGLAQIRRDIPDLVILDQMMPGMSGVEMLRILRANSATADLPVVIYSAVADDPRFVEQARRSGATDVWVKTKVELPRIPALIEKLLGG